MNNAYQVIDSAAGLPSELDQRPLEVSLFDRVVGFLLAGVCFLGLLTGLLFLIWIWPRPVAQPKQNWQGPSAGGGAPPNEVLAEFETPLAEELEQLELTTVETPILFADLQEAVMLVALGGEGTSGTGSGEQTIGIDDENADNPTEKDLLKYNRWKLVFTAKNAGEYARQLDGLQIELGVLGGGFDGVDYARDFTQGGRVRHGDSEQEKRLYFRWQESDNFARFDAQLLRLAGIEPEKRIVAMFLDSNLESEMAVMELEWATKAGMTNVADIGQTVFEVCAHDNGYRFQVIDQRRRIPPK